MDWNPEYYTKRIMVFGCGNVLLGDDGLGPAVTEHLAQKYTIPPDVCVVNIGTSIREILFDLILMEKRPERIVIIDAVDHSDQGRKPGEIFEIVLEEVPEKKMSDFSLHLSPTTNLLKELRDLGHIDVRIIACQVESIPQEITGGLSRPVQAAVPQVSKLIQERYFNNKKENK
ncbi:hydrogenase maturation protease [Planctomycetota bacterium]